MAEGARSPAKTHRSFGGGQCVDGCRIGFTGLRGVSEYFDQGLLGVESSSDGVGVKGRHEKANSRSLKKLRAPKSKQEL